MTRIDGCKILGPDLIYQSVFSVTYFAAVRGVAAPTRNFVTGYLQSALRPALFAVQIPLPDLDFLYKATG